MVDADGRQVILHGVNYSGRHKSPPHTIGDGPDAFAPLANIGLDVIRLVMVWEAIEPEPGKFDDAYLDRLAALATWAAEAGIHVIADMHQDIYSRTFGGSGAPAWTIPEALIPEAPIGPELTWFARYAMHEGVRGCLARFWRNDDGLQDHFVEAWARVAERLAPIDGVIGFEVYNEPFPGELDFASFEEAHLTPFYQRVVSKVRSIASSWMVFLEGAVLISEQGTKIDVGQFGNAVYLPHFYDKVVHLSRAYDGNDAEMIKVHDIYAADASRMGAPWMLGEYGVRPDAEGAVAYLRDQQRLLGRHGVGGTCWHYNPTDVDWNHEHLSMFEPGGAESALVDVLCRPYPKVIAGEIESFDFDDETKRFELRVSPCEGETVVYVPARHYPTANISVDAGSHRLEDEHLIVSLDPSAESATVLITP